MSTASSVERRVGSLTWETKAVYRGATGSADRSNLGGSSKGGREGGTHAPFRKLRADNKATGCSAEKTEKKEFPWADSSLSTQKKGVSKKSKTEIVS